MRSEVLGESDSATLESMHRLANTLIKDPGGQTEAMVLFRRIHATESASETTRLRAQKMTAQILMDSGDSAGAEVELRACFAQLALPFAGERRAVELAAGNGGLRQLFHCEKLLGTALRTLGRVDEAITLHKAVARDWPVLDGEHHDNSLSAQTELALTLRAAGRNEEAEVMLSHVLQSRVREDGEQHLKTQRVRSLIRGAI